MKRGRERENRPVIINLSKLEKNLRRELTEEETEAVAIMEDSFTNLDSYRQTVNNIELAGGKVSEEARRILRLQEKAS
jgi:hypothetical protein